MGRRRRGVAGVSECGVLGVVRAIYRGFRAGCVGLVVVVVMCVCVVVFVGTAVAASGRCPNEEFRTGPSASLPDCRAYELVTPENLGRTQDMTFSENYDKATPSSDGEGVAFETIVPLEPSVAESASLFGTFGVFLRTSTGWVMRSGVAPGGSANAFDLGGQGLFSSDLSQVAFASYSGLSVAEQSLDRAWQVGPVGGPYAVVADVPNEGADGFLGANAGTASVPPFSDVLFYSTDHEIALASTTEKKIAEKTAAGLPNLYEWSGGRLRLVNVEGEGSQATELNECGAVLGEGPVSNGSPGATNAVSDDGSKVFFTSCGTLYMRVDGRETVEVPRPTGAQVHYNGATSSGSKVVFTAGGELFVYDTESRTSPTYIASGLPTAGKIEGVTPRVMISEDGSTVYYETEAGGGYDISRYDVQTGEHSHVAMADFPVAVGEPSYVTPNGEFFVFPSIGVEGEPRGVGHQELYRYDAVDGSVMCVSCGEGVAPVEGEMLEPHHLVSELETQDETPPFVQMSEDGQEVFFQTTAQLVPQDKNSTEFRQDHFPQAPGLDVYEWEADGVEEEPGVFCEVTVGCTHLLSAGEDTGPSVFLGASENGSNVFLASASQLVPQATPEFGNIYDARVGGGFPPPKQETKCTSCQGVGRPAPLFGTPASATFVGAANPVPPTPTNKSKARSVKRATVRCSRGMRRSRGKCVKVKRGRV